jgi:DNA-binding beta-propeller fold protein YncE
MTQITASIQHAADTEANWIAANPVLIANQIYIASDVFYPNSTVPKIKIGKGLAWNDTEYLMQETLSNLLSEKCLHTWTPTSTFTQGQKFVWQAATNDWRTYIVRNGFTLNAGETPFTNPQKIERIEGDRITDVQQNFRVASSTMTPQKVVVRQSDGKMFATNIGSTSNQFVDIRNYSTNTFFTFSSAQINIGTLIRDIIYIESLDEVWVCANDRFITRINPNTNTVIGSIGSVTATSGGTVIEMFDTPGNFVYIHYIDGTNRIARLDKTSLTSTLIITGTVANNTVNGSFNFNTNCLYAMNPSNRFVIYDCINLTETIITDSVNLSGGSISSEIIGNRLYIGVASHFIAIYDITNPTSPTLQSDRIGLFRARGLKFNPKTFNLYAIMSAPASGDGTYVAVVDLRTNKVVDSHIINGGSNTTTIMYAMSLHNLGNFVLVPFAVATTTQGNKIFTF